MRLFVKKYNSTIFCITVILMSYGCSPKEDINYTEQTINELYIKAKKSLDKGNYSEAANYFEAVEQQHPYSPWAVKAQIMASYSYYASQKYEPAISSLESFIQMHPAHSEIPYAIYMIGLCYYEQISPVTKEQKDSMLALRTFNELLKRFPKSIYAKDAKHKIILLNEVLAGKEMEIARFYLEKQSYHSALKRLNVLLDNYQKTKFTEEALYRMVECYVAIGDASEAQKFTALLGHNYYTGFWYKQAYYLINSKLKGFRSKGSVVKNKVSNLVNKTTK